jgi:hypothetical protein
MIIARNKTFNLKNEAKYVLKEFITALQLKILANIKTLNP